MPRIPQITRTLDTTIVKLLCMDLQKREPYETVIRIPRTYKSEKMIMQKVRSLMDNERCRVVQILMSSTERIKYTMTEQQYIDTATILEILK